MGVVAVTGGKKQQVRGVCRGGNREMVTLSGASRIGVSVLPDRKLVTV